MKPVKAHDAWVAKAKARVVQVAEDVERALDAGFSTDQVADEVGMRYGYLLDYLGRRHSGHDEIRGRLMRLRQVEVDRQREVRAAEWVDRRRCSHGAWSSSGGCEHGKMGRYAA